MIILLAALILCIFQSCIISDKSTLSNSVSYETFSTLLTSDDSLKQTNETNEEEQIICSPFGQLSVWAEYHPYPRLYGSESSELFGKALEIYPTPRYFGWTDDRIERDVSRLFLCGIDGVIVYITPEELSDKSFIQRLDAFYSASEGRLAIIPLIFPGYADKTRSYNSISFGMNNLCQYMRGLPIWNKKSALKVDEKKVILISASISISDTTLPIDFQPFIYNGDSFSPIDCATFDFSTNKNRNNLNSQEKQSSIPVFRCSFSFADRERVDYIDRLMQTAADQYQNGRIIIIHSWNYYEDGSFIEPNTKDGETLSEKIRIITEKKN